MDFKKIFAEYKSIAVYGMSNNSYKLAHSIPAFMLNQGYDVIPINPSVDEILNLKCYSKLSDVPNNIDILNVFRPSQFALGIVNEAIERRQTKGDIKLIWFQSGIFCNKCRILAEENNIQYIDNSCIYQEYLN
jgi:uncharacterized protein